MRKYSLNGRSIKSEKRESSFNLKNIDIEGLRLFHKLSVTKSVTKNETSNFIPVRFIMGNFPKVLEQPYPGISVSC